MDRTQLEKEHPTLVAQLRTEFAAEGAAAERDRIQGVEGTLIRGHEALVNSMKFDGKSSPGDAALAVNAAEQKLRVGAAAALATDAPSAIAPAAAPAVAAPKPAEDMDLPVEERCKATWDKDASVRKEFTSIDAYVGYTRAMEAGNVKVLGSKRAA